MSMKHKWRLSSSNLRICLKTFRARGMNRSLKIAQFEWVELQGSWYLYNSRSKLILATLRRTDAALFIRYRVKSRYRPIIEKWAKMLVTNQPVVALASHQVGRWERRVRYLRNRDSGIGRPATLSNYVGDVLGVPEEVNLRDPFSFSGPLRRASLTLSEGQSQTIERVPSGRFFFTEQVNFGNLYRPAEEDDENT